MIRAEVYADMECAGDSGGGRQGGRDGDVGEAETEVFEVVVVGRQGRLDSAIGPASFC